MTDSPKPIRSKEKAAMFPYQAVRELLKAMPELLADYEHLAQDEDGKVDRQRKSRVARLKRLLLMAQGLKCVRCGTNLNPAGQCPKCAA